MQVLFDSDGEPSADTAALEQHLWSTFNEFSEQNVQVQELICKASMCRASIYLPDEETDHKVFDRIGASSPDSVLDNYWLTIPERETMADGSIQATMYLTQSLVTTDNGL